MKLTKDEADLLLSDPSGFTLYAYLQIKPNATVTECMKVTNASRGKTFKMVEDLRQSVNVKMNVKMNAENLYHKGVESVGVNAKMNAKMNAVDTDYQRIIDFFNECCTTLPKVKMLSEQRRRLIKGRVEDAGGESELLRVIEMVNDSDFLSGRSGKWSASFDWIMKKQNFLKIMEGNYANRRTDAVSPEEHRRREFASHIINKLSK